METFSPLYSRYNGFTLGVFMTAAGLPFSRRRYPLYRQRVQEFLDEAGLDVTLPRTHASFVRRSEPLLKEVLAAARQRSEVLQDFVGLGAMSVLQGASGSLLGEERRRILRDRWVPVLERNGVAPAAYDEWVEALPGGDRSLLVEDFLSPSTALLTEALQPLAPEPDTCFVAMPFRSPFTEYYAAFYRPALARAGLRAIRAWGGISSEEYYIMLLTLIAGSGSMLAELTTLNLNVVNEVGIAHGLLRPVFLIGDRSLKQLPSNIAHLPNLTYSRRGRDWMPHATERLAEFIEWVAAEFQRRHALAYGRR